MLEEVLTDLAVESDKLDRTVDALDEEQFKRNTPAEGWTIGHQIAHLAWTDDVALAAVIDGERFAAILAVAAGEPYGFIDKAAQEGFGPQAALMSRWRAGRNRLAPALR